MPILPRPPWARPRERCPNCLAKTPDERALACDRCGYQLRTPAISLVGLGLLLVGIGNLFLSVFGGFLFPWPAMPFGFRIPFLETPTPDDLANLALWIGVVLLLAGIAAAYAGAYLVRREGDKVLARGRAA